MRHRAITKWARENASGWRLFREVENTFGLQPKGAHFAKFYVFERAGA